MWFILLCVAAVAVMVGIYRFVTPGDRIPWRDDLPAARAEAAAANKPVLLYFTADWCGPCQYMKRSVFPDLSVAAAMEGYIPVKIDTDRHPALTRQFQVASIPMFVLLDERGEVARSRSGAMEAAQMTDWLSGS